MQTDVDTIIVHTKLEPVRKQLNDLVLEINIIRGTILKESSNKLGTSREDEQFHKLVIVTLNSITEMATHELNALDNLFAEGKIRQKRALEILGDFLSACTGVPSAQDHRKVLEQIKMLELDSRSLMNLMEDNNVHQQKIIQTLQVHEAEIVQATKAIQTNSMKLLTAETNLVKMAATLSISIKATEIIRKANLALGKANEILAKSDNGQLSRHVIGQANLSNIIDSIYLKRRKTETSPIFSRDDSNRYYELKLAHSWTHEDNKEIATLIQVPVAAINKDYQISVLKQENLIRSDLSLAVTSLSTNSYRLLSDSDFHRCVETSECLICQKRKIEILVRQECSLRINNCENWADMVVHDITNTQILIFYKMNQTAILACDDATPFELQIPSSAILTVPVNCGLTSSRFTVSKINFAHLADVNVKLNISGKPNLVLENESFKIAPLKLLNASLINATHDLNILKTENLAFGSRLKAITERHDEMWSRISGGRTGLEQIIEYTVGGILTFLIFAALGWIVKLQITSWKREGEQGQDELTREQIKEVKTRLMDLETEFQIMTIAGKKNGDKAPPTKYQYTQ